MREHVEGVGVDDPTAMLSNKSKEKLKTKLSTTILVPFFFFFFFTVHTFYTKLLDICCSVIVNVLGGILVISREMTNVDNIIFG